MRALPVVYELPGMDQVRVHHSLVYKTVEGVALHADVYAPPAGEREPGRLLPAVVFVGRKEAMYTSWGKLVAASGMASVTFDFSPVGYYEHLREPEQDVLDLLAYVRSQGKSLGIDAERLGIWACSSLPSIGWRVALRDAPPFIHCLVSYYGTLNLEHLLTEADLPETHALLREYSLVQYLSLHPQALPPMLVVRAGHDHPLLNQSIDAFVAEALSQNAPIEVVNYPEGRHGFDVLDATDRTRPIMKRTLAFLRLHLLG
jgi:acetyl esterase/lipase